ncbi:MAG: carbohydrate kinase family protein [Candidatus Levybacteria bacterium]|nr:carbohydrate kinase family protein [Candidatus Levybacteria bacterium]
MKTFDVITVGNAIIDLFLLVHDANLSMRVSQDFSELCIKAGEKIEVDRCDLMIGGNATNAAVGLARSAYAVSLIAEVGDDEFADRITKTLSVENVDTSNIIRTQNAASSMTVGINFQSERTLFVEHVKREHNFNFDNIETKWVYLTSLGTEWKVPYERAITYIKKTGTKLAFNPGTIQVKAGYEQIANALQATDILFVNKEEAIKISNFKFLISNEDDNEQIKRLLIELQKLGPKVVVVTDGKNGSYAIDQEGKMWFLPVYPANVVEKTGAGDAYACGFLAGVLAGKPIPEAMRWGSANSASVIEKIGAELGLLSKEEITQRIADAGVQTKTL